MISNELFKKSNLVQISKEYEKLAQTMREFFFGFYKPDTTRDLHQFCIFFWKYMLTISPLLIFNFIYYLVHLQVYN